MRRPPLTSILGVVAGLAATGCVAVAEERTIILGSDYGTDCPPAAQALFQEAGLNGARLTGGGYGWAAKGHAELARKLAAQGVRIYLQLGSHYPSADYFPLHDAWLVDQDGKTGVEDRTAWAISYDHSYWPQYSYAHHGIRERFAKDFTAYLGSFPSGPQYAGVILHNEPGMHWLKNRVFDYSAVGIAAFRAWLPAQHADIATLNRRWGSSFASFAEVDPPRQGSAATVGAWLDWRRFQVVQIADFMKWEAGFVHGVRPDLSRTTNLDGPTNNWYAIRCADVEAYSRAMDTVGMDIYPGPWTDRAFVPYALDQLQGVAQDRPARVIECEVFSAKAQEWRKLDEEQRADLLRSELWTMYGHGVDCILLWGFSRRDSFSVTDGEWNPRVLACRDVAHQLPMLGLGRFHRAPSPVAICLDPDAYIRAGALEASALAGGSVLDQEFHGIHAALAAAGIQCDVIMAAQLPAVAGRYRALILPASPLMDPATASLLHGFVAGGGTLVGVAPFATVDRWGAPLTAEVLAAAGLAPGPTAQQQAAADGVPAIASATRGTGRLAVIDGPVGGAYLGGRAAGLPRVLAGILGQGGIQPGLTVACATGDLPDATLLSDGANRLLVVAAQGDHASATHAATGVQVTVPGAPPMAAFGFLPTAIHGDEVRSGPLPVMVTPTGSGFTVALGPVSSGLPVLLVGGTGAGPLLSLTAPAQVKAASPMRMRVVVRNPSPTTLSGTVVLTTAGLEASGTVAVPAWGSQAVDLSCTTPTATPRLVLGVVLRTAAGETTAVPVDIEVK